jgi:RNA polymerase sigma-70 factor (ECF subfamily)
MPAATPCTGTDWGSIVREHGDTVWRLARRLLHDEADAADCFRETFVASLGGSRSAAVTNWPGLLRKICASRASDLTRRRIRDRRRSAPLDAAATLATPTPSPADRAASGELADRLRLALTALPDRQAQVFTLAVIEALPHAEVATLCGITTSHVGVLIHRARGRLRTLLENRSPAPAPKPLHSQPEPPRSTFR